LFANKQITCKLPTNLYKVRLFFFYDPGDRFAAVDCGGCWLAWWS
jgi:hypothetical protein